MTVKERIIFLQEADNIIGVLEDQKKWAEESLRGYAEREAAGEELSSYEQEWKIGYKFKVDIVDEMIKHLEDKYTK